MTRWKEYVDKIEARYGKLIAEGKMTRSSKVVPINRSLKPKQWVLPSSQALEILKASDAVALASCLCRELAGRCDAPREVCFHLGGFARKTVERNEGRFVSMEEAEEVLRLAERSGLVHLTLFDPERKVFALCSCCECCCHDFHLLKNRGRVDLVAHSEFIAATDLMLCADCGECVPLCHFGARKMAEGRLVYDKETCYGCGLCVPACPVGATVMKPREASGE
jgi:NAD-dependent dihydropyrimidine dehydrogenase PreA subunit